MSPLNPAKLDPWVKEILVDPIAKSGLQWNEDTLLSDYGKEHRFERGTLDLRPFRQKPMSQPSRVWKLGQIADEQWEKRVTQDLDREYNNELAGVREVYEIMPLVGRCLDVGGHQRRLRAFLKPGQGYLIIAPFLDVFEGIEAQRGLLRTYPFLTEPVNFVGALAEHVPLSSRTFDTVHMRSVIDHFQSPELALREAYRVLRAGGQIIIGLWVEGGKSGRRTPLEFTKDAVKAVLPFVGLDRYADHHVWHPTYRELAALIEASGFEIDMVHWQSRWRDRVCYIRAVKKGNCTSAGCILPARSYGPQLRGPIVAVYGDTA
jgi:SAM-dependent methyltransferase